MCAWIPRLLKPYNISVRKKLFIHLCIDNIPFLQKTLSLVHVCIQNSKKVHHVWLLHTRKNQCHFLHQWQHRLGLQEHTSLILTKMWSYYFYIVRPIICKSSYYNAGFQGRRFSISSIFQEKGIAWWTCMYSIICTCTLYRNIAVMHVNIFF